MMRLKGFSHCKESLDEAISDVMGDYSAWLNDNPYITVTHFDTALTEVVYPLNNGNGDMADYYTYVLTVGYVGYPGGHNGPD